MKVAIYGRSFEDSFSSYVQELFDTLNTFGWGVTVYEPYSAYLKPRLNINNNINTYKKHHEICNDVDLMISIGGDGTFLETIHLVRDSGVPILGVNAGRLGFLASTQKEDIKTVLTDIKNKQYVLYGSRESRLLSPDSSFVEGKTYYSLIDRLENHYIKDLHEKMHGKKGFKFQLKELREQKADILLGIKNTEYELSDLRNSGITTTPKGKKKRRVKQHHLMALYTALSNTEKKIKDLLVEMEEAHVKMGKMKEKLADMYEIYGTDHVPFVYNNGIYTFEDSTTFNIYTQDLILPKNKANLDYEIRLVGILATAFSKQADEVMIHINQTDSDPDRYMSINLKLTDFFDSDQFKVNHDLLTPEDSIACRELMDAMLLKDKIIFKLSGKGVGKMNTAKVLEKDPTAIEINSYPSEEHKNYREFRDLRTSIFKLSVNNGIEFKVSSFTDPVKSNIKVQNKKLLKLQSLYTDLTKNDILSALRSKALVERFMDEFSQMAGTYLDRKSASKVIDILNGAVKKSKISIGKTSVKWSELSL